MTSNMEECGSMSVPTTCSIKHQSKQGLKLTHEKIATITTKRYRANFQRLGMSQEIMGEDMDVAANATKKNDTCLFCQDDHRYPRCKIRLKLCANALEYKLSLNTPTVSIALETSLVKSM